MELNVISIVISIALGLLNFIGLAYAVVVKLSRVESRVEVLWTFQLRRGIIEGVNSGFLEHHSPLAVNDSLKSRYAIIFATVKDFYDREGKAFSDNGLAMELEKRFWTLMKEMCIKENMSDGSCLAVLLNSVRPDAKLFDDWIPSVNGEYNDKENQQQEKAGR